MSKQIMNALLLDAQAQEAKAVANLQNYMTNSAGIGEHPEIVEECKKLVKDIAEARDQAETVKSLLNESSDNR